jgi:tetratricopeptide (TPR) repeat protein
MDFTPRKKIFLAIAAILLIAAALGARPAYRAMRAYRADALAREAESAIKRQSWAEASQKAQAAYHLDPTREQAMRVVARLYTIAGQPDAVVFWQNLRAAGFATREDRRELIRAGLRFGKSADVRAELLALLKEPPAEADTLRLAADFFLLTNDRASALAYSRELVKLQPDAASELTLARSLLAMPDPALQSQARLSLAKLSALTNSVGLEAQVVMARAGLVSDDAMPRLIERLSNHPEAQLAHRLLAEELRLRLEPHRRAAAVAAFVNEFANSPLTNRLEVARWLNRQREFKRAAELIPAADGNQSRDVFLARLDALAALGQWDEARAELESTTAPIEPVLREMYLARAARELKHLPEAEAHWRRVHLELGTQPEAALYVAEYAEKTGQIDEARKAYERLSSAPEFADTAFAALIRIGEQTGGTRTLREIMRDLSARRPDDPAPQNDFAYLNLLLNERVEQSRDTARKLHEAQPNIMAFRTTLALAHLRAGEPAEARKMYEGLDLDWTLLQPGWQAVHAAVVGENGEPNLARSLARQIPLAALKPEERLLIQPWL